MKRFGYYITESSEHNAEYHPYFIKKLYPELIDDFDIPLDEYLRRCENQINDWSQMRESIVMNGELTHTRSNEYASYIMDSIVTGTPSVIAGNVLNKGLITNLPEDCLCGSSLSCGQEWHSTDIYRPTAYPIGCFESDKHQRTRINRRSRIDIRSVEDLSSRLPRPTSLFGTLFRSNYLLSG